MIFLLGLADLRRPLSVRNLDLLVLLSFSVSLWFFNRGDIFTSVPLAYPPMLYLLGRMVWAAWRGGPGASRARLADLAARRGHGVPGRVPRRAQRARLERDRRRLLGRDRRPPDRPRRVPVRAHAEARTTSGPAARRTRTARSASASRRTAAASRRTSAATHTAPWRTRRTSPATSLLGWSGKWDDLPASHATAIAFDLLALLGLFLLGRRFGGARLAAQLPFAWAAYPFTQYVSSSNTNDAIMPVLLVFAFWFLTTPFARGAFLALAAWTKFAALVVVPLWAGYPEARWRPEKRLFAGGFAVATVLAFSILLLEPDPAACREGVLGPHLRLAGRPRLAVLDLGLGPVPRGGHPRPRHASSRSRSALLVVGAIACYFVPRRKTPLQLAALTAALLIGFELTQTHWFYLYIPWFFPFVAFVVLAPRRRRAPPAPADDNADRELVATG